MPRSTLKTEAPSRRAVAAIAVPIAAAAVAGALTLAAPAQAAGSSPTLPFPTAICGTGKPTPAGGGSPTASASRSASASPSASAKASASAPAKSGVVKPPAGAPSAKSSPSPSASGSQAAGAPSGDPSAPPSATPSPTSTEGGFWGFLNGVWTFIFGSDTTQTQATPQVVAADAKTNPQADAASQPNAASNATPGLGTLLGKLTPPPSPAPPSTPTLKPSSPAASKPGTAPSTAKSPTPVSTASCVPQSEVKKNAASSGGETAAEIPWHLSTPSMTMYNLTYNGITTIKTVDGSMQALDFTASKVTLVSMVTFSHQQGSKLQYVDGGQGKTVTLNNVHLLTTSMTADVLGLLHLTFTPTSPPTALLGLLQGVTVPLPLLFTNVEADNAFLNTGSIIIPGFDGHGN